MSMMKFLLQKEFKQIFRNKTILAMIMAMPIIQLLILPLAANYEVKNIRVSLVDLDRSPFSRALIGHIDASAYFEIISFDNSYEKAFKNIQLDKSDLVLQIPPDFERNLIREKKEQVSIMVNAINGTKANLGANYMINIIKKFNGNIQTAPIENGQLKQKLNIVTTFSNWYNPALNYKVFMVPGILAILLTMIGAFLTALNIVKEKEVGTMEQINVSPIKKHHFILGKLIPFWILGIIVFTLGLAVSWLAFGIVPVGSLLHLYAFVAVYLLAILGFGLLVSTFCESQQQAMFIMFFFLMIFILMGGLFTPIESMPLWAKKA